MKVILIIILATIGSVALIGMCGCIRWSFKYLINRILKNVIKESKYETSTKKDIISIIIVILSIVLLGILLYYGLPIIIENKDFFVNPFGTTNTIGNNL